MQKETHQVVRGLASALAAQMGLRVTERDKACLLCSQPADGGWFAAFVPYDASAVFLYRLCDACGAPLIDCDGDRHTVACSRVHETAERSLLRGMS